MEFEHTLRELRVSDDAAVCVKRKWARETRLDVHFATIDTAQERANDCRLVLRATQVMVEYVGHDSRVDVARQVLDVDAVVEIGQVSLLA